MSVCLRLSFRPHGTIQLLLDGFSWNFIFEYFSKMCWENSSFIKIWQEKRILYAKNYVHLWQYLAEFFLEWEVFATNIVEKIKTHILCQVIFFLKICHLWDDVKHMVHTTRQATDDNIIRHMRIALCINNATETLRMCNSYCFSVATVVTRTHFDAVFIRTLLVLLHYTFIITRLN
jgi:hypothetical protein